MEYQRVGHDHSLPNCLSQTSGYLLINPGRKRKGPRVLLLLSYLASFHHVLPPLAIELMRVVMSSHMAVSPTSALPYGPPTKAHF